MKLLPAILIVAFTLRLMAGDISAQPKRFTIPAPSAATNSFAVHLQDGFDGQRTIITVDGREVYQASPTTNPLFGFAGGVSATASSDHPIIALSIPAKGVKWSKKLDLHAGAWLGISVSTNSHVEVLQRTKAFAYD